MPSYRICKDSKTKEIYYETPIRGRLILEHPMLNKDTAFSKEEREELGLFGLVPPDLTSLEHQIKVTRGAYLEKSSLQEKKLFLWSLYDRNETLFYRFVTEYLEEMLLLIEKGPSVALLKPRGIYVTSMDQHRIAEILDNVDMPAVRVLVVDKKGASLARAILYTLVGGIHPGYVLPVSLDGQVAKEFEVIAKKKFPKVLLDWGREEAKIAALQVQDQELFWEPRYFPIRCTHALQEFKRKAM